MPIKFSEQFPALQQITNNDFNIGLLLDDAGNYANQGDIYGAIYSIIASNYLLWNDIQILTGSFIRLIGLLDMLETPEGQVLTDLQIYEAWLRASLEPVN